MSRFVRAGVDALAVLVAFACVGCLAVHEQAGRHASAEPIAATPTSLALHAVDVEGLALILDDGDKEILIDGGNDPNALLDYLDATGIVQPPIELLIISHAHGGAYLTNARLARSTIVGTGFGCGCYDRGITISKESARRERSPAHSH